MHIAFTYASISARHDQRFKNLLARAEEIIPSQKNLRTKDISKFVWACGTLQFQPCGSLDGYQKLVIWFNERHKLEEFPESLVELLVGLAYVGIFPSKLLAHCLSQRQIRKIMGW